MHSHEDAWNAALQVAGGVTTSRDMGNDNADLAGCARDIAAGRSCRAAHRAGAASSRARARSRPAAASWSRASPRPEHAVDWYAQRGYRQVKLYNSIKPEWAAPIAAYAHERGLRVSGHVPAFSRSERVVREGYDELQHINQLMLELRLRPGHRLAHDRPLQPGRRNGPRTLDLDSQTVRDFIALLRRPPDRDRRDPGDLRGLLDARNPAKSNPPWLRCAITCRSPRSVHCAPTRPT